jgi:hypothetical protein
MLLRRRPSRMEQVRDALGEAISYANDLMQDERLRSNVRSAYGHGTVATERVREDIGAEGMVTRLAADKKLRKHLRALIDDLDSASERLQRRRSHRLRNAILVVAGTGAAVAVLVPNARRWMTDRGSGSQGSDFEADLTTT